MKRDIKRIIWNDKLGCGGAEYFYNETGDYHNINGSAVIWYSPIGKILGKAYRLNDLQLDKLEWQNCIKNI